MSKAPSDNQYFGTEKTMKILFKLAPPVMLAQLIQSLYNIVDSFFIGKFSGYALTALSVIYPMQLLICAVAVGTGGRRQYRYGTVLRSKANFQSD